MDEQQLGVVELTLAGGGVRRFFFRPTSKTDQNVIHQIFYQENYKLADLPLSGALKTYADAAKDLLVVDVGANIGASAVYLTQFDPRIHVCAIEPERGNFSVLKANSFGLPITPIEAALACEDGKLWLSDPGVGEWGFRVGGLVGQCEINAITMDVILEKFSAYRPLICKIDIEGGEKDLFRTNDDWIDQFPLIIIELHDWMLPGTSNSKNFLKAIAKRNFDIIYHRSENLFCFNNDLLPGSKPTARVERP